MSHSVHQLPRRIFGDDCEKCVERASSIPRMISGLDAQNKLKLGALATEVYRDHIDFHNKPDDISWADLRAVDTLRMAARLVFATGISDKVVF